MGFIKPIEIDQFYSHHVCFALSPISINSHHIIISNFLIFLTVRLTSSLNLSSSSHKYISSKNYQPLHPYATHTANSTFKNSFTKGSTLKLNYILSTQTAYVSCIWENFFLFKIIGF